ncbi:Cation channel sperm-associated protein 1 [Durusdinium trenchii]|uniref:Cation channel sperm-associated protein 1 n=1 Tax=Durusdinium trenchii TaxID=1381693 RepID=A0ABP0LTK0_9DINO
MLEELTEYCDDGDTRLQLCHVSVSQLRTNPELHKALAQYEIAAQLAAGRAAAECPLDRLDELAAEDPDHRPRRGKGGKPRIDVLRQLAQQPSEALLELKGTPCLYGPFEPDEDFKGKQHLSHDLVQRGAHVACAKCKKHSLFNEGRRWERLQAPGGTERSCGSEEWEEPKLKDVGLAKGRDKLLKMIGWQWPLLAAAWKPGFDEMELLFELMDADGSGSVSPKEFVAGLKKMKGPALGADVVRLIGLAQKQYWRALGFNRRLKVLNEKVQLIPARLNFLGKHCSEEMVERCHSEVRQEDALKQAAQRQLVILEGDEKRRTTYPGLLPAEKKKPLRKAPWEEASEFSDDLPEVELVEESEAGGTKERVH